MQNTKITPWEVKGNIDYSKIIKEFGVSEIDKALISQIQEITKKPVHYFLKRKIFFAHRDLNLILQEYKKGNKFFLYTGRSPSGPIHLGHLIPWIFTKWLQDVFDVELWFQFPDEEKFLFKNITMQQANEFLYENMLDVIALGFNEKKTHFLIDTKHANLFYPNALKIAKRITFSTVKSAFGLTDQSNIGQIFYTAMQAVPAFLPNILSGKKQMCLIPHAIDQDPHFRLSRDIIPKIGFPKPASIQCRFLPGLQGLEQQGKMSSSDVSTAIYTTDNEKTVRKKINKYAFSGGRETIKEHRKYGGNPDIDVSYQWLVFFEEDDSKLKQIYEDYKSGNLLSGELKAILIDKINSFLKQHQQKREKAKDKLSNFIFRQEQ